MTSFSLVPLFFFSPSFFLFPAEFCVAGEREEGRKEGMQLLDSPELAAAENSRADKIAEVSKIKFAFSNKSQNYTSPFAGPTDRQQ